MGGFCGETPPLYLSVYYRSRRCQGWKTKNIDDVGNGRTSTDQVEEESRNQMSVYQVSIARDRENGGNTGNAVSTVSKAFPRQETGFSAYLSGIRPSVSAFPRFRRFRGGVS